jgi:hypothetical protein
MRRKTMSVLAAAVFLAAAAVEVSAQGVLMNSAETINQGNIKLAVFPTVLLGKDGGDSVWGVAGRAGYGLTPRFDVEAKGAAFKDLKYFGGDVECWLVKGRNLNASVALGGHVTDSKNGADSSGIDTAFLVSTTPAKHLEIYGGLKLAFDSVKNSDSHFTLAHFVPGIEYRISDDIDFLAEVGIALNGNSRSYASVGLALYLLR